jgi:endonuclease/exonuclease/phosphatase family metal-dependent hydrolase
MSRRTSLDFRPAIVALIAIAGLCTASASALAQTTIVLNTRQQLTVDTTIRGGSYATTNFGGDDVLETRASSDDEYVRRALLKFDTSDYVPAGATIQSATLTLTVKGGNDETRTLTAYRVAESFDELAADWKHRKSSQSWSETGGTLAGKYDTGTASGTAGSHLSFDLTALVQDAVKGKFGSRYTRVAIVDDGASSRDSYRQFYSSETGTTSLRPTLTVVYGGSSTSTSSTSTGTTLPSGWSSKDLGSVGATGSATSSSSSSFTVTGAGNDVWGAADEFRFAYRTLSGDGSIVARVTTEEAVDAWTKAGVMIRETLSAGSRHAFMLVSPGKGTAFQRRGVTSGNSESSSSSGAAPSWVKLTRSGSTFKAYRSADGVTWTLVGSDSITMASTVYVGLAVSSHADPSLATANFDHVSVTAGSTSTSTSGSGTTLRVVHWNTHHGGFGTDGKYDPDRLATWVAKLKPDVVSLNEIEKYTGWGNQDQPAVYKKLLEQKTGHTWYMVWAQEYGNWSANGKGNLIFSRFPWTGTARYLLPHVRTVALGEITINGRNVTFASTHLDPDSESYRLNQAESLVPWELGFAENRIIVGDLNAQPTSSTLTYLKKTYTDGWLVAKSGGFAYSASDNPNGYTRNSRIDFVMTSTKATNLKLTRVEVVDTRDANGVMPSDHRPVLAVYEVK